MKKKQQKTTQYPTFSYSFYSSEKNLQILLHVHLPQNST